MRAPACGEKPLRRPAAAARVAVTLFTAAAGVIGSPALAQPKVHTVVIEAMRYSPQTVRAAPGDTIIWINKDPFPHTVTADNRSFDSGEIAANRSWKLKVRKKGEVSYICTSHPTMKGSLAVE